MVELGLANAFDAEADLLCDVYYKGTIFEIGVHVCLLSAASGASMCHTGMVPGWQVYHASKKKKNWAIIDE